MLAYDGSGFRGFARQRGLRTVQGVLEDALQQVLRKPVVTTVGGRTDAGVHATGQVVSFPFEDEVPADLARRLTGMCQPDCAVLSGGPAPDGFDARFSARWRRYRYRILDRIGPDPLRRHVVWHVGRQLDSEAMGANGRAAVGEHDFAAFCRVPKGAHARRRVLALEVERHDDEVQVIATATAFCHQMVRSLVGTLVAPKSVCAALDAGDRSAAGQLAPPHGLCLEEIGYD